MLEQAYVLLRELEAQINGNVRVLAFVKDEFLVLRCEWVEHGNVIRLDEALPFIDIIRFKEDEQYKLETFVTKANQCYRKKMEEMRFDLLIKTRFSGSIKESKDAPETEERQDR